VNEIDDASDPAEESTLFDEQLAGLLARLEAAPLSDQESLLEELCQQQPACARELQLLWATMQVVDMAGGEHREHSAGSEGSTVELDLQLPCQLGDYELLEEIGRGGMGIVFRARQLSLDREVAIKMISRGPLASAEDRTRFEAEARAAAQLDHEGIVPVYDVGEMEGRPFFSMKLIDGETLSQRVSQSPLKGRQAARLLLQVCRAVAFAHQHGILHRDLKPSNILIDADGRPHVNDFGLAKRLDDEQGITLSGAVLGTPSYMAPEQAAGKRGVVGAVSDVYSLGSVLYHTVTGRPPFQAATSVDTLLLVLEQDPVPPRALNAQLDRDLEMIILRCLQKPTDLRYQSVTELADDLQAYLNDESIRARSGRFAHVVARWMRETHHAHVLENWGLLWMWHSAALLIVCFATNWMSWQEIESRWAYFSLWTLGLGAWAIVFWTLRRRMGPVMFVERQIAHLWAGSMCAIGILFPVEYLMELEVLELSPALALVSGMVFIGKAGILTGKFYTQAAIMFLAAPLMAIYSEWALVIFGLFSAFCFFVPGLKYHRQRLGNQSSRQATRQP
jgi:serine/threonine-protein kinase